VAKLSDLTPDHSNANRGTERGRYALEASLRKYGAGRSILIDRNGRIIAGNKTAETAADVGIDDVIIVPTNGRQLVAVQRTDLDLDSKEARELAYADNRVGQLDLDFDPEQILADIGAGVDLSAFWKQDELDELLAGMSAPADGDWMAAFDGSESGHLETVNVTFVLPKDQHETVLQALKRFEGDKNQALVAMARTCLS
jgi:hypothetical protein